MATTERSLIGKNITITGDISATEDLVVEGRVTGKIQLNESRLTVGEDGYAHSQIFAREVVISGRVDGQIHASERVELRHTAQVTGDIVAPRLVIHQDAVVKGSVDLSPAIAIKQQKQAKKDAEAAAIAAAAAAGESLPPRIEPAVAAPQVAVAAAAYAS
jgi:cytoskeletal protein CcmA (bactofilin family)